MRLARSARSRFAGQRLPYHQNARTRRARGDRGKCRTNASLRENCHCSIGAKSRNWRKNLQSRKVKNTRHVRYSVRGGEGGIRTPDTVTRMPHFECGAFNHSATSPSAPRKNLLRGYVSNARGLNKGALSCRPHRGLCGHRRVRLTTTRPAAALRIPASSAWLRLNHPRSRRDDRCGREYYL